jgi:hypothetical protein
MKVRPTMSNDPKVPRPTTLTEAACWLLKPFAQRDVELKPSATTGDKSRALASPYADMRVFFARLDKICGVENWSHTLTLSKLPKPQALGLYSGSTAGGARPA